MYFYFEKILGDLFYTNNSFKKVCKIESSGVFVLVKFWKFDSLFSIDF